MKKVLNWLGNLIILFLFLTCLGLGYLKLQAMNNPNELPAIFGYKMLSVLSGSMSPVFEAGDIILIKEVREIKEGDIITYQINNSFVTHRVEEIQLGLDGQAVYYTKGDANNIQDGYTVSFENIEGIYQWRIPKGALIGQFLTHPLGMFTFVSCIILIFVIRSLLNLYKKQLVEQ